MIKRTKGRLLLWGLLTGLVVCFIWGNSLIPGDDSSQVSGWVGRLIGKLFPIFDPASPNGSYLLRKCAHFTEFFLLGGLLCWGNAMLQSRKIPIIVTAFASGVLVAAMDETIQRFVPGRYGCISDALLDSAGVLTGVLLLLFLSVLLCKQTKGEA